MRVLQTIPSLVPESGGTARAVAGLCTSLSDHGIAVELLALDLGAQYGTPLLPTGNQVVTTLVRNHFALGQRQLWSPHFYQMLSQLISKNDIDLIHDHCIWLPTHFATVRQARRAGRPFVVSSRGMLEPWSLRQNRIMKTIMWHTFQKRLLNQADLLHATAASEAMHLRQLDLRQPIMVIPDAVVLPALTSDVKEDANRAVRTLLFLSRIHPKKGLLNLIEALAQIDINGWEVVIGGPDERAHLRDVQAAVAKHRLQEKVRFIGPVSDCAKWQYYQEADLFVLPSFSENFGIVVAEALACGVPVITTTGTPWEELVTTKSGWWIEPTVEALEAALMEAMSLSDEARKVMGINGRQLIQQHYSWDAVGAKMMAAYRWLLGQQDKPEFVNVA